MNKFEEFEKRLKNLENELNKTSTDSGVLSEEINDLKSALKDLENTTDNVISDEKTLTLKYSEGIICNLTDSEIEKVFEHAYLYFEKIFESDYRTLDGNQSLAYSEIQDAKFEVKDDSKIVLEDVEVDTTAYINAVISKIGRNNFHSFLESIKNINNKHWSAFMLEEKNSNDILYIFTYISKFVIGEIEEYRGFYKLNLHSDSDCYNLQMNYSHELDVEELTVNDWYNDVLINEFDLSTCLDDLEVDLLDKLNQQREEH
jgi:archaellum component FlaC